MNQRIKELAEQAGIQIVKSTNYATALAEQGQLKDLEKFAELIVKEMLDIFDKRAKSGTGFYDPYEPAELIRKHFGVEE